jgi:hypothetical protein
LKVTAELSATVEVTVAPAGLTVQEKPGGTTVPVVPRASRVTVWPIWT